MPAGVGARRCDRAVLVKMRNGGGVSGKFFAPPIRPAFSCSRSIDAVAAQFMERGTSVAYAFSVMCSVHAAKVHAARRPRAACR
jgi:alpha-galactosidase